MVIKVHYRVIENVFQRPPRDAHIGVIEYGLKAHDDDVGIDHGFAETQHEKWGDDEHARDNHLKHVLAWASQPVHGLGAVVDRMESP